MVVKKVRIWLVDILEMNHQEEFNQLEISFLSKWKLVQLQQQKGSMQKLALVSFDSGGISSKSFGWGLWFDYEHWHHFQTNYTQT